MQALLSVDLVQLGVAGKEQIRLRVAFVVLNDRLFVFVLVRLRARKRPTPLFQRLFEVGVVGKVDQCVHLLIVEHTRLRTPRRT